MTCPWCRYQREPCDALREGNCDFKTLEWEKIAILQRLREEVKRSQDEAKKIDKLTHRETFDMFDRLAGISIMVKALKEEWKMTDEEIQQGLPKLSFIAKAKLLAKVKMMEKDRKGNAKQPMFWKGP